jgi:hypothetical protein
MRAAVALSVVLLLGPGREPPWPVPVPGWTAPLAGEHPRLFFRKPEIPRLRERAKTPEGQAILKRLRTLLDGADGDSMPSEFNPNRGKQPDGSGRFHETAPSGKAYTLWHSAGFGFLWQLTGERKHADLARRCVEAALDGARDRDNRYSFRDPTGALRAGPSLGAIAMAYDLAYDGWEEEFRRKVALEIQDYRQGPFCSLEELARGARHQPSSNHWGCQIGGALLALLAVRGDPGVDAGRVEKLLETAGRGIVRNVTEGFGDGGYFWEHAGPGQISSDTAFLPAVQAMKVAGGLDYVSPRSNVPNVTLIRVYELLKKKGGGTHYPLRHSSSYGTPAFEREGLSRGGQVAQGFGAVRDEQRAALLWTYENVLEPDAGRRSYDLLGPYPHRAILALVNWPIGTPARNPAEVLPRVLHDRLQHYVVFRNAWKDENDIVVTGLWGARNDGAEPVMAWGLGERLNWGTCVKAKESSLSGVTADGSGVVRAGEASLAVDFSRSSGADAFLVRIGPGSEDPKGIDTAKARSGRLTAGSVTYSWLSLSAAGKHPEPKAEGEVLVAGAARFSVVDGVLVAAR